MLNVFLCHKFETLFSMDEEKRKRVFRIYNWVRIILLVLLLTFIFVKLVKAQTTNDFGVWVSAGSEKSVRDSWIFGISTELRTKDYSKSVDRWRLGVNATYKVCKSLKLGGGYEFLLKSRKTGDWKEKVPRHRFMFDITSGTKVFNWLKLSLQERYQYTYTMQKGNVYAIHEHHLRSRFKTEMSNSKMKCWSPFASVEMFNNMAKQFQVDEMRVALGTTYNINTRHAINFGYLLDLKRSANGLNNALHVLTSGYVFIF